MQKHRVLESASVQTVEAIWLVMLPLNLYNLWRIFNTRLLTDSWRPLFENGHTTLAHNNHAPPSRLWIYVLHVRTLFAM
jgi:hypothetical protein